MTLLVPTIADQVGAEHEAGPLIGEADVDVAAQVGIVLAETLQRQEGGLLTGQVTTGTRNRGTVLEPADRAVQLWYVA